jgi:hypothetical protein
MLNQKFASKGMRMKTNRCVPHQRVEVCIRWAFEWFGAVDDVGGGFPGAVSICSYCET